MIPLHEVPVGGLFEGSNGQNGIRLGNGMAVDVETWGVFPYCPDAQVTYMGQVNVVAGYVEPETQWPGGWLRQVG
jgi:hypothetical protein